MRLTETLRIALDAIRTHRLRSLLTVLGIWIGIASVVLTVGLGQGASASVKSEISALGSNLLIISPGSTTSTSGVRGGFGSATTLTFDDATALQDKDVAPDISAVAPVASSSEVLTAGTTTWTSTVVGSTPQWANVRSRTVSSGRFFTEDEYNSGARVAVLGEETVSELFSGGSAVGQTISVNGTDLTVIGVLASTGSTSGTSDEDDTVVVPYTTGQQRLGIGSTGSVSTIYLQAKDSDALSAAYQEANAALLTRHDVTSDDADFSITSQQSLLTAATSTSKTLTILLGGIAAISLLVGGIGVMNIMLVSVSERVREIGLRKALGATPRVIRSQFLLEAIALSVVGGLLGIGVGWLGAVVLPKLINQPVTLSAWASAGALFVAIGVGIVAGVYPAGRAARLAPIDALRSE
ncbi:multidrug ABC transporter substrate-binding protein [Microlunatus endophyticus]|uniref:Multidrug ABC transporter substrate-binding protein n=1 Tax=Microlunatus endophyticus TaxID=1716077 RepID=A0A917SDI5_9ACTN|nr:ABC transporter permease [Microlunatus endophyticus]GGL74582.1 multidrug ABC transporter substrate-binding protein [Microlunatus endophyticus]